MSGRRLRAWLLCALILVAAQAQGEMTLERQVEIQGFLEAARRGEVGTVQMILDGGMPVDVTLPPRDPRHAYTVRTALESAALYARMEVVEFLLSRGASLRRHER